MKELSVNHLLGIKYINKNDIDLILKQPIILKKLSIDQSRKYLHYEILPSPIFFCKY
jgi:hypothetical protein